MGHVNFICEEITGKVFEFSKEYTLKSLIETKAISSKKIKSIALEAIIIKNGTMEFGSIVAGPRPLLYGTRDDATNVYGQHFELVPLTYQAVKFMYDLQRLDKNYEPFFGLDIRWSEPDINLDTTSVCLTGSFGYRGEDKDVMKELGWDPLNAVVGYTISCEFE